MEGWSGGWQGSTAVKRRLRRRVGAATLYDKGVDEELADGYRKSDSQYMEQDVR